MKLNQLILVASSSLLLFSCVSSKKFKTAQADYATLETKYKTLEGDMNDCSTEKATLTREIDALEREIA
jgi:chemotaxis protein MotB